MPAAVKPAERVSLTYDERNGNYNSNKTPFLKIVLPKMEIFTAQCVGRCAGKWTPFGRWAEGAHVGATPAVRQRLRGRARPGHFAPALPVLPVYRRAATCVKRRVDEGPRSLPDSSGEEQRGPQPPRGTACAPPAHPHSLLCSALLVLPPARFSAFGGSSGLIFAAERVAPAKSQAGFGLGHP